MPEIDLIPASWRAEQRTRRSLRHGGIAIAGIVVAILAGRLGLEWASRQEQAAIQQLQAQRRDGERTGARLAALQARLQESGRQQALIAARKGPSFVTSVIQPLDQALGDDIWFDELLYARQATQAPPGSAPVAEASLAIRGKAPDAAAIGRFNDALGNPGPCTRPTLTPGNLKRYTRFDLVEFSLTCPLRPAAGAGT